MKQDFVNHHLILDTAVRRIGDNLNGTSALHTASLLLLVSVQVNAAAMSADVSVFGTGSITQDTATRLSWLGVTLNVNRTYNDASSHSSYYGEPVPSARDKKIAIQYIFQH